MSRATSISEPEKPLEPPLEASTTPQTSAEDVERGAAGPAKEEPTYVEGLKLVVIMAGVTLVCFLMLLDMSILSTVYYLPDFHALQPS
jgi:hypothetical protein